MVNKLKLIFVSFAGATSMIVLLFGSVLFYGGALASLSPIKHSRPFGLEYLIMLLGSFFIIGGIYVASYLGKMLKGKYLATIALTHFIVAPSLIFFVFSIIDPYGISVLLPSVFLSNITLDVAFLIGYFTKKKSAIP